MEQDSRRAVDGQLRRIEISLRDINQLFNTMDPSPFHEKDLDADAEEFIENWVREFPLHTPVALVIHLSQMSDAPLAPPQVERAVQNYFAYRAKLNRLEFQRLMQDGRTSLLVGLSFLATCLIVGELLGSQSPGPVLVVVRESLTIAGWVAMWRPMQIYLYDWWTLRRRGKILEKLSRMPVEVRQRA